MVTAPSRALALFGTEEPVPRAKTLRAGPLVAEFDNGQLRHLKIGEDDVLRLIAFVADDGDGEGSRAILDNLKIGQGPNGFEASYDAVAGDADRKLRYAIRIKGLSDGTLVVNCEGEAVTDFWARRLGLILRHPTPSFAGLPVEIEHADGSRKSAVFQKVIDKRRPFKDVQALAYEMPSGVVVTCRLEGGVFETEDLRSSGNACFETHLRPPAGHKPLNLKAGETFEQSVTVHVSGHAAAVVSGGIEPLRLSVGEPLGTMPAIGLSLPPEQDQAILQVIDSVRKLAPQFLVCPFDSRIADGAPRGLVGPRASTFPLDDPRLDGRGEVMSMFKRLGEATGADLVLEAVLACRDEAGAPSADEGIMRRDLELIRRAAEDAFVSFDRVAVSPSCDLKCTFLESDRPEAPNSARIYDAARAAFPGVPIGGGVFSHFAELNRKKPPIEAIDFICHATCSTVHAADDITLMENLEALPDIARSVRAFAGSLPYHIGPSAIGARVNPYGEAASANPQNRRLRLARMDPRQRGLFGAAWNLGYAAHLARAGVEAVTLSAPVGEFGVIYAPMDYEQPWFDDQGSGVYPLFHVIRGLAAGAGKPMLRTALSDSSTMQSIAWREGDRTTIWIANLTGEPQEVQIEGLPASSIRITTLDLDSFIAVTSGIDGLVSTEGSTDLLDLGAYGAVRVLCNAANSR